MVHLAQPMGEGLILHVCNHRGESMSSAMMTEFEPLDAPRCFWGSSNDVFPLVPVCSFWCWQPFALDGKERVKLAVPPAFDYDCGAARLHREVYRPGGLCFVNSLGSELNVAPNGRVVGGAVEMIAEVFSQCGFSRCGWPVRVVAPAGKFLRDEAQEFQLRRGWQVNLQIEPA